jgi:hypothetical protein
MSQRYNLRKRTLVPKKNHEVDVERDVTHIENKRSRMNLNLNYDSNDDEDDEDDYQLSNNLEESGHGDEVPYGNVGRTKLRKQLNEELEEAFDFNALEYSHTEKPEQWLKFRLKPVPGTHYVHGEFPNNYVPGPQNIPDDISSWTEKNTFMLFFRDILNHQLAETCRYIKVNNIGYKNSSNLFHLDTQELLKYKAVFWSMGLVKFVNKKWYWNRVGETNGLCGNQFIKSLLGRTRFEIIDRCLQSNLDYIRQYCAQKCQENWNPYTNLSCDDQLFLWEGKGGNKVHLPYKADKNGMLAWMLVDEHIFPYNWKFVRAHSGEWKKGEFGKFFLKLLTKGLPSGPFTFYIDAGALGDYKCFEWLTKSGRKAVISISKNKMQWLWKYMDNELNLHDFNSASNSEFTAVSYFARKEPAKKVYIHFLTNIENSCDKSTITAYNRKEKSEQSIAAPNVLKLYRDCHIYVDIAKNIQSRVQNPFRAYRAWRAELNAHEYNLLLAAYVWHKSVKNLSRSYSFSEFILNLCLQLAETSDNSEKKKANNLKISQGRIELHKLVLKNLTKKCVICDAATRYRCISCEKEVVLCSLDCNLAYHHTGINLIHYVDK